MTQQTQITLDFSEPRMTAEEKLVWSVIDHHHGKETAVLGPRIAELTGLHYNTVRAVIAGLINHHGKLVASCSHGYYVPVLPEEIAEATRSLRHRAIMILLRASRLQKASLEEIFAQSVMEFPIAE